MPTKEKKKMGRPAIPFEEAWCELLLAHMTGGLSFESFGALIKVSKPTMYNFIKQHANFANAKKNGELASMIFWENLGKAGATGQKTFLDAIGTEHQVPDFSASTWIFTMKNRHKWLADILKQKDDHDTPKMLRITIIDNRNKGKKANVKT